MEGGRRESLRSSWSAGWCQRRSVNSGADRLHYPSKLAGSPRSIQCPSHSPHASGAAWAARAPANSASRAQSREVRRAMVVGGWEERRLCWCNGSCLVAGACLGRQRDHEGWKWCCGGCSSGLNAGSARCGGEASGGCPASPPPPDGACAASLSCCHTLPACFWAIQPAGGRGSAAQRPAVALEESTGPLGSMQRDPEHLEEVQSQQPAPAGKGRTAGAAVRTATARHRRHSYGSAGLCTSSDALRYCSALLAQGWTRPF